MLIFAPDSNYFIDYKMNILLLGSGGREHAFARKIKQSPLCNELFIAPGNTGTAGFGINIDMSVLDFESIKNCCLSNTIEMVIVGPEDPLVEGIYDYFERDNLLKNILVIGPSKNAAQLEGSKSFSKQFMQRLNIPTASYASFDISNFEEGLTYLEQHTLPIVLKADGLAAGKGVVICESTQQAKGVFTAMIKDKQFGEASSSVVIEQFLDGIEISVFVLTDGADYKIIGHAKDYKRIGEGETGPNTGGMGCVSPVPFADSAFMQKVEQRIIQPTIAGLKKENLVYKGFLFFGLIKVEGEPFVIEYNCRMGDPETEVVLPRLQNDLVALCNSIYNGTLKEQIIETDNRSCCTVVAVSGGYPNNYNKGMVMIGLDTERDDENVIVFHAGTKKVGNNIVTNGGRVLTVTSFGNNIQQAVARSIAKLDTIGFEGMNFRKDIGYEFV